MKILIISYKAFPSQDPRSFRTTELSEQLAKLGHEVILYTVHGNYDYTEYERNTKVKRRNIKTTFKALVDFGICEYDIFDKFMLHFQRILFWPFCELHFRIARIIKENPNMDMLITIAFPHSIHSGAAWAKRRYPGIFPKKWIADCGDPFMLNPIFKYPRYMKIFEDMWCKECDYITVPTEESYKGYYEQYWGKIRVIPQGFDFTKTPIAEYRQNEVPTFLYTGAIYPGVRDPHSFMDYLLKYDKPYKFIMMIRTPLEEKYIKESKGQIEYVVGKGRTDVIWASSKADFLINIPNQNSIQTPSTLIDYGISKRPVLDVENDFVDDTIFKEFINRDYHRQRIIGSIDKYRIENVAVQFLSLA